MVGHFIHGGVGLRQVCDWALFLSARSADIDKERLSREIRFLHMEKFWRLFGGIAVDYLGLSGNSFPDFFFIGKKEMRRAMNLILETGNFGHYFFDLSLRPKNYYGASCTDFIAGSAGRGKFFLLPHGCSCVEGWWTSGEVLKPF